MKKISILFSFALLFYTCKKEPIFDEYGFSGEGTAMLNGTPWKGVAGIFPTSVFCKPDTCIAIKLLYYEADALRGDITINHIPLSTGKKTLNYIWPRYAQINNKIGYGEFTSDGDVITGSYYVYEQNDANFVDITELNLETGDVRGSFQAVVVRDSFWTADGAIPDTIRITNGSFYGKIYWE
jgi:hypothetical protein